MPGTVRKPVERTISQIPFFEIQICGNLLVLKIFKFSDQLVST